LPLIGTQTCALAARQKSGQERQHKRSEHPLPGQVRQASFGLLLQDSTQAGENGFKFRVHFCACSRFKAKPGFRSRAPCNSFRKNPAGSRGCNLQRPGGRFVAPMVSGTLVGSHNKMKRLARQAARRSGPAEVLTLSAAAERVLRIELGLLTCYVSNRWATEQVPD